MKVCCAFFASRRYWADGEQLQAAFERLRQALPFQAQSCLLLTGEEDPASLPLSGAEALVAVPMSGAIQESLLKLAGRFPSVILYAAYAPGNASKTDSDAMLQKNAAPPLMDCWSILRRSHPMAFLAVTARQAAEAIRVLDAYRFLRQAKLLLVGETEPWVVSVGRDPAIYKKLGITVEAVSQQEIRERYAAAGEAEGLPYYQHFKSRASRTIEPTEADLRSACRMAAAITGTLRAHQADGMAIACFKLLETGTNSCLGVSYINDCTPWVAACEGDLDSAVTMLMMKRLASTKLWMANCALQADGALNFSHCTAPIDVLGGKSCPCALRSHHESGIGVSLQVCLPVGQTVTACRISALAGEATIFLGETLPGEEAPVCRTQAHVRFPSLPAYLETVLGCHQVFAFEDLAAEMAALCRLMGLRLLTDVSPSFTGPFTR